MNDKSLKYAYFPGCASKQLTKEYDASTRIACDLLGIKLIDIDEFSCCGAGVVKETSKDLNRALNGRNFALSEAKSLDMMTICSTCIVNLRKDLYELRNNEAKREEVNSYLKKMHLKVEASLKIKHLLWVLTQDYGLDEIKKKIEVPLTGLKVATFYGCHLVRPSKIVGKYQETENPTNFEDFVHALKAIPLDIKGKLDCCGFHITMLNKKAAAKMSGTFLDHVLKQRADMIVTTCPFCHTQMDLYQKEAEKVFNKKFNIPIIHMSQLLCLALGVKPNEIGMQKHIVQFPDVIWERFNK